MYKNDSIDLRLGVIGYGRWGRNVARDFANIEGADLRVVIDINLEARALAKNKFGVIKTTDNLAGVMDDIDVLLVCTPALYHFEHVLAGLRAGKHVFVEKPMSMKVSDAEVLARRAFELNRVLMVGHQMLHHGLFKDLRAMILSQELGALKAVRCLRSGEIDWSREPNVLWGYGPHDISMILALTGARPIIKDVNVLKSSIKEGILERVFISLTLQGGGEAFVELDGSHGATRNRRLEVECEDGMIILDDAALDGGELRIVSSTWEQGEKSFSGSSYKKPLEAECLYFIDGIKKRTDFQRDTAAGVEVVSLLEEIESRIS